MELPGNLTGPKFAEGDIVNFEFDDVELTLRLPVVPYNTTTIDRVTPLRDLRGIDTSDWETYSDDGFCLTDVSYQNWRLEDSVSHDDIAHCILDICFQKYVDIEAKNFCGLHSKKFFDLQLQWHKESFFASENNEDPDFPSPDNDFYAKRIPQPHVDGFQAQVEMAKNSGIKYPDIQAAIPLGKHFLMSIRFKLSSFHYSDRKNPYSDEHLQEVQAALFDDFLSYIHVEYRPETLVLVEQLKREFG